MKQIKRFDELNKASKVRRINNIKRHHAVPAVINELYNEYINSGKEESLLYVMKEIMLNSSNISNDVKKLLL